MPRTLPPPALECAPPCLWFSSLKMGKCSDQTVYLRNLRAEPLEIADLRLECVNGFMKPDTQLDIVAKPMYRFHLKPAANVVVPPKSEVGIRVTVRTVDKVTKRFEEFMEIRLRTGELFSYSVIIDPGVAFAKTKKHATPQPVLVVQAQAPQASSSTTAPAGGPRASSSRSRSPTTSRLHAADERDLELLRDLESSNNMLRQQLRKKRATDATNAYMQCLEEVERDLDALRLETSPREEGDASNDGASRRQHETVGAVDGFSWVRRVESALNQNKYNAALNRPPVVRQKKNSSGGAGPKADERNLTATTQRKLIQKLQEESAILRQAVGGRIAQGSGPLRMKKRKRSASAGRGGAGGSKQAKPTKSRAGKPTAASAAGEIEDKLALHAQLLSLEAEVMELRADLLQQTSVEGMPELEQLMGASEDHDQPMGGGHGGGHANATIKGSSMDIVSSSTSAASSPNEAAAPADLVLTLPSSSSRGVSDSDGAKKELPAFYGQTLIRPEESARKKRLQKEKRRAARAAKEGASATATGAGDSTLTDYFREGPPGGASSKSPVSASDESPIGGLGEVGASPRSGSSKLPFSPVGLTENDRREFAAIFDPPNASQSPKKMQRTRTVGVDIYVALATETVVSASCTAQTSTSPLENLSPTGERIPMLLDEDRGASGQIEECRAAASHELVVFSTSQNRVADAGPTSEQQPKRDVFEAPASPPTTAAHAERDFNAASEDVEVVRPPAPVAGTGSDREDEPSSKPSSVVHHSPPSPRARGPQGGHSSSPSAAEADDEDDHHGIPSELSADHEELLREHRTARLKAAGGSAIIKWHEEQDEATRPRPSSSRVLGAGGSGSGSDANEDIASAPASPKSSQAGPGPAPGASNAREQGEVTSIAANSNINTTIVRAEASGDHDELEGVNDEQYEAPSEAAAAGKGEDPSASADNTTRAKTELPEAPDNIHDNVNLNVLASPSPRRGTSRSSGGADQQEDQHVPPPGPCSTPPGPVTHTPSNVQTPEEVVGLLDAAFVNVQQISAQMVASPDMQTVNDQLDYILVHEIQPLRMRLSNMEKAARDAMEEKVEAVFALLQTIQDQIAKSVLRRRDQVESAMDDAESKASAADLGSHRHGIQELLDVQPVLDRAAAVLAHYPVDSPGSAAISAPPALELDLAAPLESNAHADSGASSADSLSVVSEDPCDEPSMRVTRASIRRLIVRSLRVSGDPVHQIQMPRPAPGSGATATALGSGKNARRRSSNILPLPVPQDSSGAAAEGRGAAPAPGVSSSGNESISSAKIASENMRILREEYHADSYPNTPARGSKDVPGTSGKGFFGDEFEQSSSDAPEDPGAPPITRAGGATQFDVDLFKCEMHERVRDLAQKALRKRLCYVSVGQLAERSKTLAESIESHTPDDLQGSIKCKKSHAAGAGEDAVDVTAATAEGRSSAVGAPVVHPTCVPPGSQGEKTDAEPDPTLLTLSFGEQTILQQLLEKVLTAFVLQKQDFHKEAQQQNEGTSSPSRWQLLELDASSMAMARLVAEIEMILSDLFDRVLLSEERLLERSPKQKPSPDDFRAQVGGGAEALLRGGTGAKNFVAASAAGSTLPAKTAPPAEAGAATNESFELPLFDELTVNPLYAVTSLLYSDPLLIHDGHPRHDIPNVFAAAHDATRSVELSVLSARSEDDARGLLVDAFVDDLIQEGVVHDQRTGAHQSQHLQYPGKNIGAARRTGSRSKAGSPHSPGERASGNRSNRDARRTSRRTGSSASAAVSATSSLGPAEVQEEEEVIDAGQKQNLRLSSASASASSVRLTPLEGGASASRRSSSAVDDPMSAPLMSPSSMMFQRNKNMFADMEMDANDGEEIVDEDIISEQVADDWANLGEDEEASVVDDEDEDDAAAVPFRAVDEPAQAPEYEENQGAAEENSASESGRDYRNSSRNSSMSSSSSSGSSQQGHMDTSYSASRNQSADAENAEEELLGRSSSASAATEGEHQIASSSAASSAGARAEKMTTSSRQSSKASGSGSGSGPPQPPARRKPSAASSASSSSSSSATPLSSACSRDLDAALAQFEELQSD